MNNKKISALVVAHNEEKKLGSCLKRLKYADEIVVVVDKSSDSTKDIALKYGARVFEGSWKMEGKRRNYGISKCNHDWILEIDADEHVPAELFMEIRKVLPQTKKGYFLIPFDNFIGKKKIRYGWGASWGVSAAPRLSYKGCKIWNETQTIHPSIILKGKKGKLENRINHYVDEDLNDMLKRLIRYTDNKSFDIVNSGNKVPSFWIVIRKGFTRFIKCFFTRKGYKEGKWGFLIALMAFLYLVLSYLKADSIKNKK